MLSFPNRFLGLVGLALLLFSFAPFAFGQGSVNITLTSGGPYVMNGVYVGPYSATVNGQSAQIICDDFAHDSYLNESWTANVTNLSNLASSTIPIWSSTTNNWSFSGQTLGASTLYADAAWLVTQMLLPANQNTNTEGYLAYALWSLFNPSALKNLTSGQLTNVNSWLSQIPGGLTLGSSQFANFFIYTPDLTKPITCNGGSCPTAPPQEFFGFLSAAEGGSTVMYLLLAAASCCAAMFFRSRRQAYIAGRELA